MMGVGEGGLNDGRWVKGGWVVEQNTLVGQ